MRIRNELRTAYFISTKYFKKNYALLIFITIILAFSFVNIVFFSSFNKGIVETLNSQLRTYVIGDIYIEPTDENTYIEDVDSIVKKLDSIPGIKSISPRYEMWVTVTKKDRSTSVKIISIDPEKEYDLSLIESTLIDGSPIGRYETDTIMLGVEAVGTEDSTVTEAGIDAQVGDMVEISYGNNLIKKDYRVKGLFDTNFWESDFYAFVNHKGVASLLDLENKASAVLVRVDDTSAASKIKRQILNLGLDIKVSTWDEKTSLAKDISESLSIIEIIMIFAGVLIASITIFITIYINIIHRMRFIGILEAIGLSTRTIIFSYLFQTMLYCFLSIIIGLGIILILTRYFYLNPILLPMGLVVPFITTKNIIIASLSVILASLFSALIPSYNVTRKNIIETIFRGER